MVEEKQSAFRRTHTFKRITRLTFNLIRNQNRVLTFYNIVAPIYGAWATLTESRAHSRALELIRKAHCETVLEIAVGTGNESAALAADQSMTLCAGIDLSAPMLKRARKRIERISRRRALLCQADARALPFQAASFDCLLSCYMMDLLPEHDIPLVLHEFRRILRPQGLLILAGMGEQERLVQRVWMALFRRIPAWIGSCRPIHIGEWLRTCGWHLEYEEHVTQIGLRSEVLAARARPFV